MRKLLIILIILVISTPFLSCQTAGSVNDGEKSIVVTYSILGSIVKELVGDQAKVTISIPNGLDLHEWEPSAKDIEAINKADLVIQNGLDLEGGMEKTLWTAQKNGVRFFTATDHIKIRHIGISEGIPSGDPDQTEGAPDPHLWTDPLAIKSVVRALAEELKQVLNIDITNQAINLENRLDALDKEINNIVSSIPQANRKLVTGHESMGYFAQRYGFKVIGIIIPSLSTQAEVSAANLAALKKTIEDNQVKAIFAELGTSMAVAKTLGNETGVQVVELSTHILPADDSYFTFLSDFATTIANALK